MEATNQSSVVAIQKVEGKEGNEHSFKVLEPSRWEMSESKLEGVNEGGLHVAEGKVERRGVSSYFCTKVDVGERAVGSKLDVVIDKGLEGSDKVVRVIVKLSVMGNGA